MENTSNNQKDEVISAFAFNTGKAIEQLIIETTNNLQEENRTLKAAIMSWYVKTRDEDFKDFFYITKV